MRKSKKFLFGATIALVFVMSVITVSAGAVVSWSQKLNAYSSFYEMSPNTKTNTTNEGYVVVNNMAGTSSLGFRARGKWYDGSNWNWTNFGPTTNVTYANTTYTVYYMQSLSASMPVYLSVRNNTSTSSRPTVSGTWQYDY